MTRFRSNPRHRRRRLHRLPRRPARCSSAGDAVVGLDNRQRLLRPGAEGGAPRACSTRAARLFRVRPRSISPTATRSRTLFASARGPDRVVHLAAQAGVRHSLENPHAYVDAQFVGFRRTSSRRAGTPASSISSTPRSSSVYGAQHARLPFSVARQRRPPAEPLRRDQEGERADGASYAISSACRRRACASSPSTGPGAGPTWRCCSSPRRSCAGRPIQALQPRPDAARLHLRRRHRRGRRPACSTSLAAPDPTGRGDGPDPATQHRARSASTTSATTAPVELRTSSP